VDALEAADALMERECIGGVAPATEDALVTLRSAIGGVDPLIERSAMGGVIFSASALPRGVLPLDTIAATAVASVKTAVREPNTAVSCV
jgi:hypothetical protein